LGSYPVGSHTVEVMWLRISILELGLVQLCYRVSMRLQKPWKSQWDQRYWSYTITFFLIYSFFKFCGLVWGWETMSAITMSGLNWISVFIYFCKIRYPVLVLKIENWLSLLYPWLLSSSSSSIQLRNYNKTVWGWAPAMMIKTLNKYTGHPSI